MLRPVKWFIVHGSKFKVKSLIFSLLSGAILALPFVNGHFWIFAWFGFVPLLLALKNKSKVKAFFLAYLAGVIFWSGTIYWLIHVTLPGTAILVLYLALYFGAFGFVSAYFLPFPLFRLPLILSSVWIFMEYLRSYLFTGFPWALLGYSQYLNLPIIQVADIAGVWGVSFLIMLVNITIYEFITYRLPLGNKIFKAFLPVACLIAALLYGREKIILPHPKPGPSSFKVSVIQGNIPQELKWDSNSREFIMDKYMYLSGEAADDKPDLIVWPEASLPAVPEEEPWYFQQVTNFAKENGTNLLLGAVTRRDNLYFNSAILLGSSGKTLGRYDKLHLVPFGEYIPLKKVLSFLETVVPIGEISRGKEYALFTVPNLEPVWEVNKYRPQNKFAVLICFEDLFPELSREFVRRGADILINITNDAWYKKTTAPYQHLAASVFRAVENRVYLVRSANTGISGFISPQGKIIALVQDKSGKSIFVDGYRSEKLPIANHGLAFYNRHPDTFIFICLLFTFYCIIFAFKREH